MPLRKRERSELLRNGDGEVGGIQSLQRSPEAEPLVAEGTITTYYITMIKFTKMHGCGNDYIYIDGAAVGEVNFPALARAVSDRHKGIGSDGLVVILPPQEPERGDVRMRMFNSDGSEAEMCGNASRCVGKYVYDRGMVKKETIRLETKAGIKILHMIIEDGRATGARVDMGEPEFSAEKVPFAPGEFVLQPGKTESGNGSEQAGERAVNSPLSVAGKTWGVTAVSMGNPHAVTFVPDVAALNLPELGPQFETHPAFPAKVNTEFVQIIDRTHVKMRVWERGAGETLACGTGACATLVAAVLNGLTERHATVELLGGELNIEWNADTNHVLMTGPAVTICDGEFYF